MGTLGSVCSLEDGEELVEDIHAQPVLEASESAQIAVIAAEGANLDKGTGVRPAQSIDISDDRAWIDKEGGAGPAHPASICNLGAEIVRGTEPIAEHPLVPKNTELAMLLEERALELRELRQAVGPGPEDDLALLRHLLSEGKVAKAQEIVEIARRHRTKYAHVIEDAHKAGALPEYMQRAIVYNPCLQEWPYRAKDGAPLDVNDAFVDLKGLMANVSADDLVCCLVFKSERFHMVCDKIAREEGRLVKVISILDFAHVKAQPPSTFIKAVTEAGKITEAMYPQLQRAIVLAHGKFVVGLSAFLKLMISKRAGEKLSATRGGRDESCPMLFHNIGRDALPPELGGNAKRSLRGVPL